VAVMAQLKHVQWVGQGRQLLDRLGIRNSLLDGGQTGRRRPTTFPFRRSNNLVGPVKGGHDQQIGVAFKSFARREAS
jgi:hypothetical protein